VTFTPTDTTDYTTATASVMLNVSQSPPQITWTPTALIALGVPLGPGQLDATATAPGGTTELAGSFLYSPPAGTIFNTAGPQTLSVTFTPADMLDYTTAQDSLTLTVSFFGVVAWGDSLTFGEEGYFDQGAYPEDLQNLLYLTVENLGVKGQTSTQIGVREGGVPTYATVAGGMIPASGGVTVTFPTGYEPVTADGPAGGVSGTILGVRGVVTLDSGVYTFTPTTPGTAVSAPGSPQFVVDTPFASYLPVFWEGRNNYTQATQVLSDLAAQVATVPSGQNYLILSIPNENSLGEWINKSDYKKIIALNNQLAAVYGSHYLDIWKVLVDSYDPTLITDVSDYNHGEVPTSLRPIYLYTTLVNAIGATDTSITVQSVGPTDAVREGFILTIDSGANAENVKINAVSGNILTVVRNYGGVNGPHAAGAQATVTDDDHLNAQGAQIVANAVANYLSAYAK
jgi:lysophospholipase L1-like esterase